MERDWVRTLMISLGALVAVALLVGGLLGMLAVGAANVAGVTGEESGPSEEPSLYLPESSPTPSPTPPGQQQGRQPGSAGSAASQAPDSKQDRKQDKKKQKPKKKRAAITLSASPSSVSTYQRINLTGRYRGGNGTVLQVQRFQGGWVDFPTTATVRGGSFGTYVETGRSGTNRFRVVDKSTGRASKPVSVRVR